MDRIAETEKMNNIRTSEAHPSLKLIELVNARGTRLEILNFGAALFSLKFQREGGEYLNVLVSPERPEDFLEEIYKERNKCFGASIGRYAGRISEGYLPLDDAIYPLLTKEGVHLHGGEKGFAYQFWKIEEVSVEPDPFVRLSYFSEDGEEGYPGNLEVSVTYTLTEENDVKIEYEARTNKPTVVNLTNHAYFNLNGGGDIKKHLLQINADKVLETGRKMVPTGNFVSVKGTTKDYKSLWPVGNFSLDDAFVLKEGQEGPIYLKGDQSNISLQVYTDQASVVVYAPEKLPGDWNYQTTISDSMPSICLECQNFPDAPHNPDFPSSVLRPGEVYRNVIRWKFKAE